MAKCKNIYRIDPDALRNAFRKSRITAAEAARRMGYTASFFSVCYTRGWISVQAAKLLQQEIGIYPSEYVIGEIKESPDTVDYDKLAGIIYEMCSKAIKDALE